MNIVASVNMVQSLYKTVYSFEIKLVLGADDSNVNS
jgi:hypothetical protein